MGRIEVLGGDYPHTRGLTGRARGLDLLYRPTPAPEIYRVILGGERFAAAEFSLSAVMMLHERGEGAFRAIPVFPNRAFRQAAILVRKDDARTRPTAFAGLRVGVIDYSMTAAVWARAILSDAGLDPEGLQWVLGGPQRFPLPGGIVAETTDADLEALLAQGGIDLLIHPHSQDARRPAAERRFRPLLDDPEALERAAFAATGVFPINHTVVIHDDARAVWPDLPGALAERYAAAKAKALAETPEALLPPWTPRHGPPSIADFAGDPLPYGLGAENRRTILTLGRHLVRQRLLSRVPEVDALFLRL